MSNPVTTELFRNEGAVPPPDMLLVGPHGAVYTDTVRVDPPAGAGWPLELKRGTLLMWTDSGCTPCTAAGLETARGFAILADAVTIDEGEHAATSAYFEGDFNQDEVIFPWLDDEADRAEALEAAREPLRRAKIFLRAAHD